MTRTEINRVENLGTLAGNRGLKEGVCPGLSVLGGKKTARVFAVRTRRRR